MNVHSYPHGVAIMPVKKGRTRSAVQAESSSPLIPNKKSVDRTVWVSAHEQTGDIVFDGVDGEAYWRLANVVAGAPLHSETAESSDARVLVVVCEGSHLLSISVCMAGGRVSGGD